MSRMRWPWVPFCRKTGRTSHTELLSDVKTQGWAEHRQGDRKVWLSPRQGHMELCKQDRAVDFLLNTRESW